MPFSKGVAGGQGKLLVNALTSPNFSTGTKTGWSVDKNGDATFYSLTIQGGSIIGVSIYTYKGTPGPGTLFSSLSNVNTTDQFGNQVRDGYTIYANGDNGPAAQMAVNQSTNIPYLILYPGGAHNRTAGQLFSFSNNTGLANESVTFQMFGPQQATNNTGVIIQLNSAANDSSTEAAGFLQTATGSTLATQAYWDATGVHISDLLWGNAGVLTIGDTVAAKQPGTTNTSEQWHGLPLSGWTPATGYAAQYRFTAQGDVQLAGRITTTGTSSTITTALPSGYFQLGKPFLVCPIAVTASGGVTAAQTPRIALSNTGVITVAGLTVASGTTVSLDGVIFPVSAG